MSELGTSEAFDCGPTLDPQGSSDGQRSARPPVYANQDLVFRALQELDEKTIFTVRLERPEVRPDFAGLDAGCGDRAPIIGALR
jgi:hypothetical protein